MIIREQYELQDRLGAGGMGEVWRARDLKLDRDVAVKRLLPGQTETVAVQRFLKEARTASRLNHPNVVVIYDVIQIPEGHFIVMEFVSGRPLDQVLAASGPLPPERVQKLATQIAEGLAAAHDAGIVHRDLKPGNIMIDAQDRVKLLDFGLAQWNPEDESADPMATQVQALTQPGNVIGTWPYMSPEQAQGKTLDARSDIFSFGVVLYELSTGRRPFQGENGISLLSSILRDVPERVSKTASGISTQFDELVHRCLEKDPALRYASAHELAKVLRSLTFSEPPRAAAAGATTPAQEDKPKRSPHWALAAVALGILGAGGAWLFWRPAAPKPVASTPVASTPAASTPAVTPVPPATKPPAPAPTSVITVPDGLPVGMELAEDLQDDAQPEQPIALLAVEPFEVEGRRLVAPKAAGTAVVAAREKRRQFVVAGKGVRILARITGVRTVSGQILRLRTQPQANGNLTRAVEGKGERPKGIAALRGTRLIGYVDGAQAIRAPRIPAP